MAMSLLSIRIRVTGADEIGSQQHITVAAKRKSQIILGLFIKIKSLNVV
jgi:hypothetical protein